MDIFKLGIRNFFSILLPGTILVISVLYLFFNIVFLFDIKLGSITNLKDLQLFIVSAFLLVSYFLGSIIWHGAPSDLDKISINFYEKKYIKKEFIKKIIDELQEIIKDESVDESIKEDCEYEISLIRKDIKGYYDFKIDKLKKSIQNDEKPIIRENMREWIEHIEEFPYPVYEYTRFKCYPAEMLIFYTSKIFNKSNGPFYRYCKNTTLHESSKANSILGQEIMYAEAAVRMLAGLYYSMRLSVVWILVPLGVIQLVATIIQGIPFFSDKWWNLLTTLVLGIVLFRILRRIIHIFRGIRVWEVDTVYSAFYLISEDKESRRMP